MSSLEGKTVHEPEKRASQGSLPFTNKNKFDPFLNDLKTRKYGSISANGPIEKNSIGQQGRSVKGASFTPPTINDDKFVSISDYKICSLGKCFRENVKRHVIKFHAAGKRIVDLASSEFTPPVKIQRRNVLEMQQRQQEDQQEPDSFEKDLVYDASKVAPYGGAQQSRKYGLKQKTRQVFHDEPDEARIRKEERLPWVIEDFDGKQQWIGHMEGGMSANYMLFIFTIDGFKVVKCDKFYRFTQNNLYNILSIEEAEAKLNNKNSVPRWFMKNRQGNVEARPRMRTGMEWSNRIQVKGRDSEDELDYMEVFPDDEETPYIEGNDEDNKELEIRIKREMLSVKGVGYVSDGEADDEFGKREVSKQGKKLQRYLMKLEKNQAYESSSESENPYVSELSETDSDEEYLRQIESVQKDSVQKDSSASALNSRTSSPIEHKDSLPIYSPLKEQYLLVKQARPFLVTLKISSQLLKNFSSRLPQSKPIEDLPKKHLDESKKVKLKVLSSLTDNTNTGSDEANLIMEDEVANLINSKKLTTIEMLRIFNDKFKKDKRNKERITLILRKVAKMENGYLVPK